MTTLKSIKSVVIDITRLVLLFLVMFLPLIFIIVLSQLAVKIDSLLGIFLFLPAVILMHYFLGKYGSIYKLVFTGDDIQFTRDDIQFSEEHKDINMALLAGSAMYLVTIIDISRLLINTPWSLTKIGLGIIIVLLLVYVLHNRSYYNALKLIEKIWGLLS